MYRIGKILVIADCYQNTGQEYVGKIDWNITALTPWQTLQIPFTALLYYENLAFEKEDKTGNKYGHQGEQTTELRG